ncbi:MAG: NAD(P)/FAD-dependent oxidoreductase [Burkholderiaceae bacterium]|nr:MAG: NAD(P)/FAD-dependent oxidoreductase [Burkholderiaceae bacterium]
MGAFVRGTLLFLPLVLLWRLAGAPWDSGSAVVVGLAMLAGVALRRPWTAWGSASDWNGMTADPLFLQINQMLSALWGGVLVASGIAWALGGSPVWRWAPSLVAGVSSVLLPPWWVRRQLAQRIAQADPNPWASPLEAAPAAPASSAAYDVAVVGAGLGGLTAAALLARAGARVAVFEQHDKPGGFCHCWEGVAVDGTQRLEFRFDGGVHDISGVFEGGTVANLVGRLDLHEVLSWHRLDHAFVDDGRRWDVPRGWDAFTEALVQRFPGDAAGLRTLLADVHTIFAAMYATAPARGGVPGLPASVSALKDYARANPLAVRWMPQPFEVLLDHHRLSAEARALLRGLAGYVTHDPSLLTVAQQVPLLGYFLHGGHYPAGGSGALSQALADSLALDGGELHLGCAVQAVRLAPQGAGIEGLSLADGRRIDARAVVLAGDAIAAGRLLQPAEAVPPALRAPLGSLQPATSMFSVHLGVRGAVPALPPVVHLHRRGEPGVEMVLPGVVDASAAPAGYYTVELMRLVGPDEARGWFDDPASTDPRAQRESDAYQQRKAREADAMIELAQTLIPGLREAIVFRREASPLTFRRYGFSTMGSIYGVLGADGRAARLPRRSPVPGLVFAGSAAAGAGVEPAMMSGAEAADALLPGLLAAGRRLPAR